MNKIKIKLKIVKDFLTGRYLEELSFAQIETTIATVLMMFHILLCFIFLYKGIWIVAAGNILSVSFYLLLFSVIKREKHNTFFRCVYYEILLHVIFVIIMIGDQCGFELYCIGMVPVSYYTCYIFKQKNEVKERYNPLVYSLFPIIIFILLELHCMNCGPIYDFGSKETLMDMYNWNFIIIMIALIAFMSNLINSIFAQQRLLKKLSVTDTLTGLDNRRAIDEFVDIASIGNNKMAIALADIDDFKNVNDTYGHDVGDKVLIEIASIFRNNVRSSDKISRWGGEEILLILLDADKEVAVNIIEKIISNIKETPLFSHGEIISPTLTIGVVDSYEAKTLNEMIEIADQRMYYGKKNGKNRIVTSEE